MSESVFQHSDEIREITNGQETQPADDVDGEDEDEPTYKIQYIIHARACRSEEGKPEWRYLIQWEGYPPEENTYEPRECIESEPGGKAYLRRFWNSTGLPRDVRQHYFGATIFPSDEWIEAQLNPDPEPRRRAAEEVSEDDEPLDERMRLVRETRIRQAAKEAQENQARDLIARLHASSSSSVAAVTPQKRPLEDSDDELLSSGGVWTGKARPQKGQIPGKRREVGASSSTALQSGPKSRSEAAPGVRFNALGRPVDNPVVPLRFTNPAATAASQMTAHKGPSEPHPTPVPKTAQSQPTNSTEKGSSTIVRIPNKLWQRNTAQSRSDSSAMPILSSQPGNHGQNLYQKFTTPDKISMHMLLGSAPPPAASEPASGDQTAVIACKSGPPSPVSDSAASEPSGNIDMTELFGDDTDDSSSEDEFLVPWRMVPQQPSQDKSANHGHTGLDPFEMDTENATASPVPEVTVSQSSAAFVNEIDAGEMEGMTLHTIGSLSEDGEPLFLASSDQATPCAPETNSPSLGEVEPPGPHIDSRHAASPPEGTADLFVDYQAFQAAESTTSSAIGDGAHNSLDVQQVMGDDPTETAMSYPPDVSDIPELSLQQSHPSPGIDMNQALSLKIAMDAQPPRSPMPDGPFDLEELLYLAEQPTEATPERAKWEKHDETPSAVLTEFNHLYDIFALDNMSTTLGLSLNGLSPSAPASSSPASLGSNSITTGGVHNQIMKESTTTAPSSSSCALASENTVSSISVIGNSPLEGPKPRSISGLQSSGDPFHSNGGSCQGSHPPSLSSSITDVVGNSPGFNATSSTFSGSTPASIHSQTTRAPGSQSIRQPKGKLNSFVSKLVKKTKAATTPVCVASLQLQWPKSDVADELEIYQLPSKSESAPSFKLLQQHAPARISSFISTAALSTFRWHAEGVSSAGTVKCPNRDGSGPILEVLAEMLTSQTEIAVAALSDSTYLLIATASVASTVPFLVIPSKLVDAEQTDQILAYVAHWPSYPLSHSGKLAISSDGQDSVTSEELLLAGSSTPFEVIPDSMLRDRRRVVIFETIETWHGHLIRHALKQAGIDVVRADSMNVDTVFIHEGALKSISTMQCLTHLRALTRVDFVLFGHAAEWQEEPKVIYPRNGRVLVTFTWSALAQEPVEVVRFLAKLTRYNTVDAYVRPVTLGILQRHSGARIPKYDDEGREIDASNEVLRLILAGKLGLMSAPPSFDASHAVAKDWQTSHQQLQNLIEADASETLVRECERIAHEWYSRKNRPDLTTLVAQDLRLMAEQPAMYKSYRRFILIAAKDEVKEAQHARWEERLQGIEMMTFRNFFREFPEGGNGDVEMLPAP